MIPIICVDNRMGILFNKRRLSRDEKLYEWLLSYIGNKKLWMNEYSSKLFPQTNQIIVSDTFYQEAGEEDYCFVECGNSSSFPTPFKKLLLCHWNRNYPYDTQLELGAEENWKKEIIAEFQGNSHDKITIEEWNKR